VFRIAAAKGGSSIWKLNGLDRAFADSAIDRHSVKKVQTRCEKYIWVDGMHTLLGPEIGGIFSLSIGEACGYSGHRLFNSAQKFHEM
jgi:hypothetical protein